MPLLWQARHHLLDGLSPTPQEVDDIDEEADDIIISAARHHDEFVEQLYSLTQKDQLNSKELVTLINMSKHIEQCVKGLVHSARNYLSLQK